jgi:uncharacterized protein (TIGR02996 family)
MSVQKFGPTVVESAADDPQELGFLSAIVADQLDETSRLVYADWLDEHDDPRGAFLREFVESARDPKASLPDGDEFPLVWRQVTGIKARASIRDHVLWHEFTSARARRAETRLLRGARPTLYMVVSAKKDDKLPIGCTKVGGCPDLPPDVAWPIYLNDTGGPVPLIFCAQIRLSELRNTVAARELPAEGLLSFFFRPAHYCDPGTVVLLSPESAALRRVTPPPDPNLHHPNRGGAFGRKYFPLKAGSVRLIESLDLPVRFERDYEFEELHRVLRPIDDDFQVRQLLGNGLQYNGSSDRKSSFRRLAVFGGEKPFLWGDSAMPIWYMAAADLAAGRFDKAQCYEG